MRDADYMRFYEICEGGGPKRNYVLKSMSRSGAFARSTALRALRMEQKGAQTSTLWPKTEAELVTMNVEKCQERQNVSIAFGPTALVLGKSATRGPKTEAELAAVIISKFQKRKNASIACRPTTPVRQNKCDTWAKAR